MEIQSISLAGNWETSGLLGQGLLSLFIYLFIYFYFFFPISFKKFFILASLDSP